MSSNNFIAGSTADAKKKQSAKKSLFNYVNQLQIHFDLNDVDVVRVLESVVRNRKNNVNKKKWWQVWK